MNHAPCVMTTTEQFFVRVCGCGVVHLSFGPAVINVTAEAMIAVTETMKAISDELRLRLAGDTGCPKHSSEHGREQASQVVPQVSSRISNDDGGNVIFGRFPGNG